MTFTLFCSLLIGLGAITTLFVEFVKSVLDGYNKTYNNQTVALLSGAVIGIVGTVVAYVLMTIPFTPINIAFIVFESVAVIIGAQLGYDKVLSVLKDVFTKKSA